MAADQPNATWHPALMPNSSADVATEPPETPETSVVPQKTDEPAPEPTTVTVAPVSAPAENHQGNGSAADAWFPEYDKADGAAAPSATSDDASRSEPSPTASDMTDKDTKHLSTISFSRTVSNDVHWDAEESESEWSPRTNTDPFRFMSPSNRTNSFPVVPPLETSQHAAGHSDPATPAMDAIPEVDLALGEESHAPVAEAQTNHELPPRHDSTPPYEQHSSEAAARFEEGVPLIPREAPQTQDEPREAKDPFADEDDDDGFFNNVDPSANPEAAADDKPSLERKSTMQVLQSMNVGSLTRNDSGLVATPEEVEFTAEEDDFFSQQPQPPAAEADHAPADEHKAASGGDLAAQWAAALAEDDDDELLLEDSVLEPDTGTKEIDPAAFFGDDDEGFLDDVAEDSVPVAASAPAARPTPAETSRPSTASRYLPQNAPLASAVQSQPQQSANPYLPATQFNSTQPLVPSPLANRGPAPKQFPMNYGYQSAPPPVQQQPSAPKAQSFADKAKGGYHSPYDLPMDVVKPRKRPSLQHLPRPVIEPPVRSSSVNLSPTAPPMAARQPGAPPQHATTTPKPALQPAHHESFFEDLPMMAKPRPASRHSQASPSHANPYGPPHESQPPLQPPLSHANAYAPPPAQYSPASLPEQPVTQPSNLEIAKLMAPPRESPYAALQSSSLHPAPPAPSSRYSPSPNLAAHPNGAAIAPPTNRYSPAPSSRVSSGGYAPVPAGIPPPMILPHQPRTSSPLAHFEMSYDKQRSSSASHVAHHGENHVLERRNSSSNYEPRLTRVPSLPPTREVEEDDVVVSRPSTSGSPPRLTSHTSPYTPQKPRQTPPPTNAYGPPGQTTLSPPKRALNYMPQSEKHSPPSRTQTQSSLAQYGNHVISHPVEPIPRPASVQEAFPAAYAAANPAASVSLVSRPRAPSQHLNLVPPADGTETDPLERWKGAPVFAWGVGGTFVSSFPQDIPRYGMNQVLPMIHRAPGDVHVQNIRDIQPLEERLAKFPGPLKGKSKKKEVLAWLTTGIEVLERSLPRVAFPLQASHEDKRLEERILLWKILRLFIEYDGVLEGAPAVDKAVRDVLSPFTAEELASSEPPPSFTTGVAVASGLVDTTAPAAQAHSDAVDSVVVEQIRKKLLLGDKEKAAWDAVDKRLWGHAFLIAGAASPALFKKVAQEFVRAEVNSVGHNNESLAALYEVLSGNHEECIDELVPVHARAGLQLMTTGPSPAHAEADALAGLDKWRETLCLILNNRSVDDVNAINSLGCLLSGYGRAEAAHVCFLFSRTVTVFGGLDDPLANVVLLGADHKRQLNSFAKETDAVLLSEVYEYGLSLAGGSSAAGGSPHLAAYKLQHAMTLAEYGFRDRALQYCEAILAAMTAQTRRSPYHHAVLEATADDLMKRLKLSPGEGSSSWIPKPSMNKVSDTMWNRFNKFVAGDESEGGGPGSDGEGGVESGPFAHIAGGTPTISRPPSANGVTGMEMFGGAAGNPQMSPPYGLPQNGSAAAPILMQPPPTPATRAGARYAPTASTPSSYEPAGGAYMPMATSAPSAGGAANPYEPSSAYTPSSGRGSLDQPRRSSELSPGYAPGGLTPSPGYAESSLGRLSRKSSYTPLSQAEPVAPSASSYAPTSAPAYPYAPAEKPYMNGTATVAGHDNKSDAIASNPSSRVPSYGYEPPSLNTFDASADEPASVAETTADSASSSYEPPSFQPYSYEPPSYDAEGDRDEDGEAKPKKGFMEDDEDDIPALKKPSGKSKEERDRENAEMVRKIAEEEEKRAQEEKEAKAKKGWGLTSWFGGAKKETIEPGIKPIKANLGEKSSFYFDPELKRWVNKTGSGSDQGAKSAPPPPPPRSTTGPPSTAGSRPSTAGGLPPPPGSSHGPPPPALRRNFGSLMPSPSVPNLKAAAGGGGPPPMMMRSASSASLAASLGSTPPSRPGTSMSDANSIDDLLGAPGPRKAGAKRNRKGGRYVDVMAK